MKKQLREQVRLKYNNKCAYTGTELESDWQVDHIKSQFEHSYFYSGEEDFNEYKKKVHDISNLLPAQRIINHYKRSRNLEQFRVFMMTFHVRLSKLPKNTKIESTKNRIKYMNKVAEYFGITTEKPFNGKFYFETI